MPESILPPIVNVHFSELQALWEQRSHAVRNPDYFVKDLADLDERIEAHADGLVVALQRGNSMFVEALGAGEPYAVFAAAYPLLQTESPDDAALVLHAFRSAEGAALLGFRDAFCHAPTRHTLSGLRGIAAGDALAAAAIANECLVFHGQAGCAASRWLELVQHEDPTVRSACWRSLMWRSEAAT